LNEEQRAMVIEYMGYAESIANRHRYRLKFYQSLDIGDLYAAAHLGLCRAVLKFDASRGADFKTVCFMWVQQATRGLFQHHNRENGWTWRTPRKVAKAAKSTEKRMYRMLTRTTWPTREDKWSGDPVQLDFQAVAVNPDEAIDYQQKLGIVFDALKPRERRLLAMRLKGRKQEDIGHALGISKQRVWDLEQVIIKRANEALADALGMQAPSANSTQRQSKVGGDAE
jgi:RNA polymerase sigma factor (sigma-70 family)